MASVKRVLGAAGAAAIVPFVAAGVAAGVIGVRDTFARGERPAPRHLRGGRCADAGTVVGTGRGGHPRHVDDPADGAAVVHRVRRSLRTLVRRTRRGRRVLRPGRLAGRSHAPASGAHRGARRCDRRAARRARGVHVRQRLGPGRRRTRRRAMAFVLRQPRRAGAPDATPRRTSALARRRPRPEHGTGARPPDAPRPATPRGTRRQRRTARAPAARSAVGGLRTGSDVRVERLPGQQRARSDAVDLGHPPVAVVAPRRTGCDRPSVSSACRSARTCAACCRRSRPTWPA